MTRQVNYVFQEFRLEKLVKLVFQEFRNFAPGDLFFFLGRRTRKIPKNSEKFRTKSAKCKTPHVLRRVPKFLKIPQKDSVFLDLSFSSPQNFKICKKFQMFDLESRRIAKG